MKESKSSLQSKGCKRKTTVQLDELSDILCSMGVCSAAKKVSFNIGGNEFSVTFDRRVFFLINQCVWLDVLRTETVVEKGKEEFCGVSG
jgi:hypothetical protein